MTDSEFIETYAETELASELDFIRVRGERLATIAKHLRLIEWQPIATPPPDGEYVLLYGELDGVSGFIEVGCSYGGDCFVHGYDERMSVTHWIPLPKPPEMIK